MKRSFLPPALTAFVLINMSCFETTSQARAATLDLDDKSTAITKEISDESEPPPPEFPYPGATEEGFDKPPQAEKPQNRPTPVTRPVDIRASGEYFYGYKSSDSEAAASIRFGFFVPPDITNPLNNTLFEDLYGNSDIPTVFFDYEWMLTRRLGDIGLKVGSGVFAAQGEGRFAVEDKVDRAGQFPDEEFTFIMFPNTITAIYRFQYSETQFLVPYIEGGGGYFTFMEIRDDGENPKFGGALTGIAAAGVNILLDWLDPHSVRQLDSEWGINHVWLTAEYRKIKGLNDKYDFSSSVINGGIMMQF